MTDVFAHPWLSGLFEDPAVSQQLSADVTLAHMLEVEAAFSIALGEAGVVSSQIAKSAAQAIRTVSLEPSDLKLGTKQDGLPVPFLVRTLKQTLPVDLHPAIHQGLTSQDVIDTALVLSLKTIIALFSRRLTDLIDALSKLDSQFGDRSLMGRTRMQAALPILVSNRIAAWRAPLERHVERLDSLGPNLLVLQLGGPVGTCSELGENAPLISEKMADILGLEHNLSAWHTSRDGISDFANWLSLVSGALGKIGQDIALMAQQGIDEVQLAGGGNSSAMPHKKNPILAELLVTLAKFNATQLAGMHHALLHEQERSGSSWSLEWMLLPQMVHATGRGLMAAMEMCEAIEALG